MSNDADFKQLIGWAAKIAGYTIKKVATSDDLKERSLTVTLTCTSEGWRQDRLPFEDDLPLVATANGNGEVMDLSPSNSNPGGVATTVATAAAVTVTDPNDLTEKDETQGAGERDPDDEKPKVHLVGEAAAAARRRRR